MTFPGAVTFIARENGCWADHGDGFVDVGVEYTQRKCLHELRGRWKWSEVSSQMSSQVLTISIASSIYSRDVAS